MLRKKTSILLKKINLIIFCVFYIAAGTNHLVRPSSYLGLIPPYLPYPYLIILLSGLLEILGGMLMIFPKARKLSACLVIILMILFIPAHVYTIQQKGCVSENLCVPEWVAWVRLFPLQFVLIWWAWKTYRWGSNNYFMKV